MSLAADPIASGPAPSVPIQCRRSPAKPAPFIAFAPHRSTPSKSFPDHRAPMLPLDAVQLHANTVDSAAACPIPSSQGNPNPVLCGLRIPSRSTPVHSPRVHCCASVPVRALPIESLHRRCCRSGPFLPFHTGPFSCNPLTSSALQPLRSSPFNLHSSHRLCGPSPPTLSYPTQPAPLLPLLSGPLRSWPLVSTAAVPLLSNHVHPSRTPSRCRRSVPVKSDSVLSNPPLPLASRPFGSGRVLSVPLLPRHSHPFLSTRRISSAASPCLRDPSSSARVRSSAASPVLCCHVQSATAQSFPVPPILADPPMPTPVVATAAPPHLTCPSSSCPHHSSTHCCQSGPNLSHHFPSRPLLRLRSDPVLTSRHLAIPLPPFAATPILSSPSLPNLFQSSACLCRPSLAGHSSP